MLNNLQKKNYIVHTKYLLRTGKNQESSYCDEARLTSKYSFFQMTPGLLLSSVSMHTQPLFYKWACPNFNSKQNLDSWEFFGVQRWGGVETGEGFW